MPERNRAVFYKVKKSSASTRNSSRQADIARAVSLDSFAAFCKVKKGGITPPKVTNIKSIKISQQNPTQQEQQDLQQRRFRLNRRQ